MKFLPFILVLVLTPATFSQSLPVATPAPVITTKFPPTTVRSGEVLPPNDPRYPKMPRAKLSVLARPEEKDLELVKPDQTVAVAYSDFLKQSRTGLIRLLSDAGCQESVLLVSASEFCIIHKGLYGGSAYSFRRDTYSLGRFADIAYKSGRLYSVGNYSLGFMVDLGENLRPDKVDQTTPGAKYLLDFKPPKEMAEIDRAAREFDAGRTVGGFDYQRSVPLVGGRTYLLRSVAYRRSAPIDSRGRAMYDIYADDVRRDVVVALKVIGFGGTNPDDVTILWKELRRDSSPKIAKPGN